MGKVIRKCRKGQGSVFRAHTSKRIAPAKLRKLDYIEKIKFFGGLLALLALIEQKMMEVNVIIIIPMHVL